MTLRWIFGLAAVSAVSAVQAVPHVNWEHHPQNAIAATPDGQWLAVAHTADARVQFFRVGHEGPVAGGSASVGLDPVAVRFRSNDELWVVNHVSDSISIIDMPSRTVRDTRVVCDEPFDVVFARNRAFISCSQDNSVWVLDAARPDAAETVVRLAGEEPRALSVSADGSTVGVAFFESGNASTVLSGGLEPNGNVILFPNAVSHAQGPYGGQNPPPNRGTAFDPPKNPLIPALPVGLIVKRDAQGRWRDDNGGDWTDMVTGNQASLSGRRPGWTLPDRDLALIDAQSLEVRYQAGLMNIGMALAFNPASKRFTLVGTDATNEIRYEPNVNATFVRVELAAVGLDQAAAASVVDLNPHLDYRVTQIAASERMRSVADPRGIAWRADGQTGYVVGMGSNSIIAIEASGARRGPAVAVGRGPVGLVIDEARERAYVWNHFDASLSVIDLANQTELERIAVFNPLPASIRDGRAFLYDAHLTSGLGQASCGSCHVDARLDRLAWDLGDPTAPMHRFDQNCVTERGRPCTDFHPMKGPMVTQTLQDIIGHEPHHWRGDRAGIEAFNGAFVSLLGRDRELEPAQMQAFEDFLATITYPPNPLRGVRNELPTALELRGHYTSGRFAVAGQPLGTGNAQRGLTLYATQVMDPPFICANCHSLPTGMAVNGPAFAGNTGISAGGLVLPAGPDNENHLGVVSLDGSTNVSIKVPQLRNLHEKVGFELTQLESLAGFGFLHDGSVDSLARFLSANVFQVRSDQDVADLVALMLAFSGSDFPIENPRLGAPAPVSRDSHAAIGKQVVTRDAAVSESLTTLLEVAAGQNVGLSAHVGNEGYAYEAIAGGWRTSGNALISTAQVAARASASQPVVWTAVPAPLSKRLALDRDGDGLNDAEEQARGSGAGDPADNALRPRVGLWNNPARAGHGMDIQLVGGQLSSAWYTYDAEGRPTWYLAVAPFANPWRATLQRYQWDANARTATAAAAGTIELAFDSSTRATFHWSLSGQSGSEPWQPVLDANVPAAPDRTGIYFDPAEPGWGLVLNSDADLRVAVVFLYDEAGNPRWVLGAGANAASTQTIAMSLSTGFCPSCPRTEPVSRPAGRITLGDRAQRRMSLETAISIDGVGPSLRWLRPAKDLSPIVDPPSGARWQ